MKQEGNGAFWLRWVAANGIGEAIGLSAVLLVGFGVVGQALDGLPGPWPAILSLVAGVLLGVFEGVVVGGLQVAVVRRRLPHLETRTWIVATILGAMVAWGLGMLPSSLMAGADAGGQAATEPPEWLTTVLAGGLGLVAGIVLGLPQWAVLRRGQFRPRVRRPALWLPANSLAWLLGMPLVFLGMGSIPAGATILQAVPIVVAATATAGVVVGAVHGLFLVRIVPPQPGTGERLP